MLNVLSISTDGFSLTFLSPNLKNTAEGSLAYGDFIRGVASHGAFLDNSQRILIEGNQSSCAVVFYRSAFTWLPFYVLNTPPPTPPVTSLLHQDFYNLGLKGKKKDGWLRPWLKSPYANDLSTVFFFFKFGHRKVKENPSALIERTFKICKIAKFESDTS